MKIALVGEPNTGKTSLFNLLTGSDQFVGNWPGVTVEQKRGYYQKNKEIELIDLPGIYSLSPYTAEEKVAQNYIIDEKPDLLLNIIDGSNLERNLYLTLQFIDLNLPMTIAVNMLDTMKKEGIQLDNHRLSNLLGVPVTNINAVNGKGIDHLMICAQKTAKEEQVPNRLEYDSRLEAAIQEVITLLQKEEVEHPRYYRWYALKLLERDETVKDRLELSNATQKEIDDIIKMLEMLFKDDIVSIIINERYACVEKIVKQCVYQTEKGTIWSERLDRLVTNRFLALPIFALVIWFVYFLSIQTIGTMGTDWLNDVVFGEWIPNGLDHLFHQWSVSPWLQSLVIDGIVAGVGSVLGFLPQLVMLFLCLAFLEDCGYMARIAYILDYFFRKIGLSGKSFIPMLISTGCGVPGIMSCRTIENEKERQMTIALTTFMPCSAKLAIIGLVAGAFFPNNSFVAPLTYFICFGVIILSGLLLKKTKYFQKDRSVFLMELPVYHWPTFKNLWRQTWHNSSAFVKKAGTIIFLCSMILWFTSNFNFIGQMVPEEDSILAVIGKTISFIFAPLGFGDWKATVAVFVGLSAKENVVNTLGVLYHQTVNTDNGQELWTILRQVYTPLAGFSFLLFNLICAPCFAAIGAMKRELGSMRLAIHVILFQCGLAYVISFIVYQLGSVLLTGEWTLWSWIAVALCLMLIYLIVRKERKEQAIWEISL